MTEQYQARNSALRPRAAQETLTKAPLWLFIFYNLAAAFGYIFLAKIGYEEGVLGVKASVLWPPSGLCVYLIYKYGKHLLSGLWLGAILSGISLTPSDYIQTDLPQLAIALFNGSAALLQALAVSRATIWIHSHTKPQLGKQVVLFILAVLLLSTISSILSNLCLAFFGKLSQKEWLANAALWWMGDAIGILVMLPVLTWLDSYFNRNQNAFANAYFIGSIGTGMVLLIFTALGHHQHLNKTTENERKQSALLTAFKTNLDWAQRDAGILQDYFSTTPLTQELFENLAKPLLAHNPVIDQLAFIPVKNNASNLTNLAFENGVLLAQLTDGSFKWTKPEETYYPSIDVNTISQNLSPQQTRLFWKNNEKGMAIPFINVLHPVLQCSISTKKTCELTQLISVEINFTKVLEKINEDFNTRDLHFSIHIKTSNNQVSQVLWNHGYWEMQYPSSFESQRLAEKSRFDLNQAVWHIEIIPPRNSAFLPSFSQWLVIIIGLSLTALLTAYINILRTHDLLLQNTQTQLEHEISLQTQQLRETNQSLTREIDERHKTQEQLKHSENHLRTLLDNIPDPVWLKSIEGEYLGFNKTVSNMFFRKEEDVVGKKAKDYIDAELSQQIEEHERVVLASKAAVRRQMWMYVPQFDQKRLMDIIKIAVVDEQANSTAILSIARDITEQHLTAQALENAKNAAEEATRAKSRFLANMSHEIRTPMNAVLGYAQLLMTDAQLSALQKERLEAILKAGQRLLNLINDILDLSKIEAGALLLREEYFDLTQEINDIVLLMRERASTKGLDFVTNIQMPEIAIVKSDRHKIGQVLLNLLGNAIKFTPAGHVSLSVSQKENGIEFFIKDTGPGIAEQEMQNLFSAFKQGKAGEDTGGTGLGLVISKHIIEHLKGNLELTSEPTKGTLAHLYLPLSLENNNIPVARHAPLDVSDVHLKEQQECKVLVVEDDQASRELLQELLQKIGCKVTVCENGQTGLSAAISQDFNLLFTDIRMPELDGIEMLKQLREHKSVLQLPAVAVSASSLEHERTYYLHQGFQEFIGKPYKFNDIYRALELLSGAQFTISANAESEKESLTADWSDATKAKILLQQLNAFAQHLANGDIQTAKKLFNQLQEIDLGTSAHQQIQQALRHYDTEQAEQVVASLIEDIQQFVSVSITT